MSATLIFTILFVVFVVSGTGVAAWAAQLDAVIDPDKESFPFMVTYYHVIIIEYPNGGSLADALQGKEWTISGTADESHPGVRNLIDKLNQGIAEDGSSAKIVDLTVDYKFQLDARTFTSIDSRVIIEGNMTNHIIAKDSQRTVIDLGWRDLSATGGILIDGVEINYPLM